jgi:hypothetical protein
MTARHDERAFDVYLFILKTGGARELDVRALADSLGLGGMTREAYRRQVRKVLVKLRDGYGLIRFDQDYNGDPRVEVLLSSSSAAVPVPRDYWDYGWNRRLDFPGKTFLLASLFYSRSSPDRPRWTVPGDVLASRLHVSRGFVSRGVVALRRAGLVDVEYGELGRDPGPRDASVYTPRGLYDPLELERQFRRLLEIYGEEKLARARRYAALVYDDSDAPAVERLIRLEEERGTARMEKAAALLAAKNPDNPRRTMAYFINTVRNLP